MHFHGAGFMFSGANAVVEIEFEVRVFACTITISTRIHTYRQEASQSKAYRVQVDRTAAGGLWISSHRTPAPPQTPGNPHTRTPHYHVPSSSSPFSGPLPSHSLQPPPFTHLSLPHFRLRALAGPILLSAFFPPVSPCACLGYATGHAP